MAFADYITVEWKGDIMDETITADIQDESGDTALAGINILRKNSSGVLSHSPDKNDFDVLVLNSQFSISLFGANLGTSFLDKINKWHYGSTTAGNNARVILQWGGTNKWMGWYDGLRTSVNFSPYPEPSYNLTFTDGFNRLSYLNYADKGSFTTTDNKIRLSEIIANCLYTIGYTDFTIRDFTGIQNNSTSDGDSFLYNYGVDVSEIPANALDALKEVMKISASYIYQDFDGVFYVVSRNRASLSSFFTSSGYTPYFDLDYTSIFGVTVGARTSDTNNINLNTSTDLDVINYSLRTAPGYDRVNVACDNGDSVFETLGGYVYASDEPIKTINTAFGHELLSTANAGGLFRYSSGTRYDIYEHFNQTGATIGQSISGGTSFRGAGSIAGSADLLQRGIFGTNFFSTYSFLYRNSTYQPSEFLHYPVIYDALNEAEHTIRQSINMVTNVISRQGYGKRNYTP